MYCVLCTVYYVLCTVYRVLAHWVFRHSAYPNNLPVNFDMTLRIDLVYVLNEKRKIVGKTTSNAMKNEN